MAGFARRFVHAWIVMYDIYRDGQWRYRMTPFRWSRREALAYFWSEVDAGEDVILVMGVVRRLCIIDPSDIWYREHFNLHEHPFWQQ